MYRYLLGQCCETAGASSSHYTGNQIILKPRSILTLPILKHQKLNCKLYINIEYVYIYIYKLCSLISDAWNMGIGSIDTHTLP